MGCILLVDHLLLNCPKKLGYSLVSCPSESQTVHGHIGLVFAGFITSKESIGNSVTLMTASFVLIMHPKMSTQAVQSAVTAAAGDDDDDDVLSWSFKPKISGIAMVQTRLSSCPQRL